MRRLYPSSARPARFRQAHLAGEDYGVSDEPNWRTVDWREHLRQTQIAGRTVNYVDIGTGEAEPVVIVHGLAGQWQNWLENVPRVARDRRVIALDLPGHGFSDMPHERISIPGYGRCVEALCDRLELGKVAVVGNSMGGFIGCEVAIQFPARVERIVLVSAAGITTANVYRSPARLFSRVLGVGLATGAAQQRALALRPRSRHVALALVARHPSKLRPDLSIEGLLSGAGKPGFQQALLACIDYDFRDRLPEIGCPTLIVWGENDMVLPVKDAGDFERLIPNCRKLVMEETGHVAMAERPVRFNDCLLEFLAEEGQAAEESDVGEPTDEEPRAA